MLLALFVALAILTYILIKSADIVVFSLQRLSHSKGRGSFVLSALLLALATSFPEFFVGVTSALQKSANLSLGVVLGSNIANISFVTGFAALITGKVVVRGEYLKKDVLLAFLAGLAPVILASDGNLSRVDGLILLSIYGSYASSLFQLRFMEIAKRQEIESYFHRFFRRIYHIDVKKTKTLAMLFLSLALLLFSADALVSVSKNIAVTLNIPVFIIGVVILALGTSLPELAFSMRTLEDKEPKMFLGNLLGSTIVNSTLIVGTTVLINPIDNIIIGNFQLSAAFFVVVYLLFWNFIKSKMSLSRWEAAVLIIVYLVFIAVQLV